MDLANILQHLPFLLIHMVGLSLSFLKFSGNNRVQVTSVLGFLALTLSQLVQIANRFIVLAIKDGSINRTSGITLISLTSPVYFLLSITGWVCILLLLFKFMHPESTKDTLNA